MVERTEQRSVASRIEVRPSTWHGWVWRVDQHECSYECGAGGCDGQGWRATKRGAARAARRYLRRKDRSARREAVGWVPICRRCDGMRVVPDGSIAAPCPVCQPRTAAGWATDRRNPKAPPNTRGES